MISLLPQILLLPTLSNLNLSVVVLEEGSGGGTVVDSKIGTGGGGGVIMEGGGEGGGGGGGGGFKSSVCTIRNLTSIVSVRFGGLATDNHNISSNSNSNSNINIAAVLLSQPFQAGILATVSFPSEHHENLKNIYRALLVPTLVSYLFGSSNGSVVKDLDVLGRIMRVVFPVWVRICVECNDNDGSCDLSTDWGTVEQKIRGLLGRRGVGGGILKAAVSLNGGTINPNEEGAEAIVCIANVGDQ